MPQYLVIRLHPDQPIAGAAFTPYLTNLSLNVYARTYAHPNGVLIGTAAGAGIVRHSWQTNPNPAHLMAVATAVIEVPAAPEFLALDIQIAVYRNNQLLWTYDWCSAPATLTATTAPPVTAASYMALSAVSAYLAIPAPGQQLEPLTAHIALDTAGSAPGFNALTQAIAIAAPKVPIAPSAFASLSETQSLALARLITWDFALYAMPMMNFVPPVDLDAMYTLDYVYPPGSYSGQARNANNANAAIVAFLGDLTTQQINAADRLGQYIYASAGALAGEATSRNATSALLTVPVSTSSNPHPGKIAEVDVNIQFTPTTTLNFDVPAPYFYALTSALPTTVGPADRYLHALSGDPGTNRQALDDAVTNGVITQQSSVTLAQAVRRLQALAGENGAAAALINTTATKALVSAWLAFNTSDDIAAFWSVAVATGSGPQRSGQLELVLDVVTDGMPTLVAAIEAIPVANVDDLANLSENAWTAFFTGTTNRIGLLSPNLLPGATDNERVMAFVGILRKFYDVKRVASPSPAPVPVPPPQLAAVPGDLFAQFLTNDAGYAFSNGLDANARSAIDKIAGSDTCVRDWLTHAIQTLSELNAAALGAPQELSFSVMEALYARGFTGKAAIQKLSLAEFSDALTGSVAFNFAAQVFAKAGGTTQDKPPVQEIFQPVNPDGMLTNCIPPAQLSPLGPVAFLHEMLGVSAASTCADPTPAPSPAIPNNTLAALLASRRGPLGNLSVSQSNLETPIPFVDIVNECLEAMVAASGVNGVVPAAAAHGVVYDTASTSLAGHLLHPPGAPAAGNPGLHDPIVVLGAIPEHSSPAAPVGSPVAYDKLRRDFSAPGLPYSQPLDINRAYLGHLGTSRFETLLNFRKEISEFLPDPDPAKEPAGFDRTQLRAPYRAELFCEYLGISPEEYATLFTSATIPLSTLFGYSATVPPAVWVQSLFQLPEFLKRTGLSYCEAIALSDVRGSGFREGGGFRIRGQKPSDEGPACEPCCLQDYHIDYPGVTEEALRQLAVFIRLWRILQAVPNAKYTFAQLRDIADVFGLFDPTTGVVNPDFIRQLSAFQMLRDDLCLPLIDRDDQGAPPNPVDADSTHLLALWKGPAARKYDWAVDEVLARLEDCARHRHGCGRRGPEFVKLLRENLAPLAVLCGADPWDKNPAHTLRFVEVLAKICASRFTVGEILFICTNAAHLSGDDPFAIATAREANDSPLDLPDDDAHFSLWALRRKLLAAEADDAEDWTWTRFETSLKHDFGYVPPSSGTDPLTSLGQHFFPSILAREGHAVPPGSSRYRAPLAGQPAAMWNTPLHGPFQYDATAGELWAHLPLSDEAVLTKLSRLPQLGAPQRDAVRDLYFAPRAELARFAFLFANFESAARALIAEGDENLRWAFFQREFARCHARCVAIARHLAEHGTRRRDVDDADCDDAHRAAVALAWRVLRGLLASGNRAASSWEDDSGNAPATAWPRPGGGAFAALLGLAGTGLVREFRVSGGTQVVWRELGGAHAFSHPRDAWNAPVPTIIPAMDLALPAGEQLFASVRNGLGFANANAERLGGLQGFSSTWRGGLLIEREGRYQFWTGLAAEEGEIPDCPADGRRGWRLVLKQSQREWVYLSHNWRGEESRPSCTEAVHLRRGVYQVRIEFAHPEPRFALHEEICPQHTGFQIKYKGPDTEDCIVVLPFERLFQERTTQPLSGALKLAGAAKAFADTLFTSSLADIRSTYQRALKAFLFAERFGLSAKGHSDDGQSEIGYMLDNPARFAGTSYYLVGATYTRHRVNFDFNFLPVGDNYSPDFDYTPPASYIDERTLTASSVPPASIKRQQAFFDQWERIFAYANLRRFARHAPERSAWLLFHEAAENNPNTPDQLLWHLDVDVSHQQAVLYYFGSFAVATTDLLDERWPIRIAHANRYIERVKRDFLVRDIRDARPDLWAADDPGAAATPGNANLTKFVQDGSFENGEPRRYAHTKTLNDGLRERGRAALLAFLCALDRVTGADGAAVRQARQLSDLLLLDVETGLCEKASRIEEAIAAVELYVQRARLGLEPAFKPGAEFCLLWDRHFTNFRTWEACKRRDVYSENWIEWDELEKARRGEAFRFLEDRLRRAGLTSPAPGGVLHWPAKALPPHDGIGLIQNKEPSGLQGIAPQREGFGLLGTPERQARLSWLARGPAPVVSEHTGINGVPSQDPQSGRGCLPLWIETANRLGGRFARVAAAGVPPASLDICRPGGHTGCCAECGKEHAPSVDEYYFWLIDTRYFTPGPASEPYQDPLWDWHNPAKIPTLLQWDSKAMVHLLWCKVHNGEFQQPRRSSEGVRIASSPPADLVFMGRTGDSLRFEVIAGVAPTGYAASPPPGFRYDMATDSAVVLPLVALPAPPPPSYPYFLYFPPGAPIFPQSCFSPSLALGDHLRAHCRFEDALKWYACAYAPLERDNHWAKCHGAAPQAGPIPVEESACCDSTAIADPAVIQGRAITLRYVETLVQWADSLMCRNSPEAFQRARQILDTAARILGPSPRTIGAHADADAAPMSVASYVPHIAALNPRLLSAYETIDNRLSLIHTCLDGRRLRIGTPNKDMPYWGNSALRDGWKTAANACDDDGCCSPCKPYRFSVLVKQAQDLANEVKGLGSALLAAYEKGDSEYLASLRTVHENQLHALTLSIRQNQWYDSNWQVEALKKSKEQTQLNRTYKNNLFIAGLIAKENLYEVESLKAIDWRLASNVAEVGSELLHLVPDVWLGEVSTTQLPVGTKLAGFGAAIARALGAFSDYYGAEASLDLTRAGWLRRAWDWLHDVQVHDIEIQQIEDQILGADRRRDMARSELDNHQRQMEQSGEVLDFLRDKFTNHSLYGWMQKETAALYYKAYELALHAARSAQRAFNNECGHTTRSFIPQDAWDGLHEGLLAGDRLQLALKQMEKAYYEENCREYELSKHISLRLHDPLAFLKLKAAGSCQIELPEWLFDQDYPGQYMRRIRSVSLTLPCVTGPYVGVHCRLTLLSSATRVDPRLSDEGRACCADAPVCNCGYRAKPDDARIVRQYSAVEAIATSSGQNDAGLFELSFRDERYLPFELAGAVSRWRLELPPENNFFDLDTLSDAVLHLNYTAREGGAGLRAAAHCEAARHLPGDGWRLIDVKHDMPNAWQVFSTAEICDREYLPLRLSRRMFPYVPEKSALAVGEVHVFFETDCATPSRHHAIELLDKEAAKHCPPQHGCKRGRIECVASAEWPRLFHGVVAGCDLPLDADGEADLGSLWFPPEVPRLKRAYLVVRYSVAEAKPSLACDPGCEDGRDFGNRRQARRDCAPEKSKHGT